MRVWVVSSGEPWENGDVVAVLADEAEALQVAAAGAGDDPPDGVRLARVRRLLSAEPDSVRLWSADHRSWWLVEPWEVPES